jgi:hypothetical protein
MGKKINEELLNVDRRIIARKLLAGEMFEKDIQSYLKKLPDVADNIEKDDCKDDEK